MLTPGPKKAEMDHSMTGHAQGKRRWKRLSASLQVHLRIIETGREMLAIGTHMNPSGIFIQLADPPAVGTAVQVSIASDNVAGPLTAQGTVAHQSTLGDEFDRPPGIGINLHNTGPAWTKIYEFLIH